MFYSSISNENTSVIELSLLMKKNVIEVFLNFLYFFLV